MRKRLVLAVVAGLLGAVSALAEGTAEYLGSYSWNMGGKNFGGFSGLELSADGQRFVAISDSGFLIQGALRRKNGVVSAVDAGPLFALKDTEGNRPRSFHRDSEGLAIRENGRLYVSFEGFHRVWTYSDPESEAAWLPRHPDFKDLQNNSSLEALAIGPDNSLYAIPERSGKLNRPYPVYRYKAGTWTKPFTVPRKGVFLVAGADIGPDGRFYLLERHFAGIFGFSTRVRSFALGPKGLSDAQVLIETNSGTHDNLEGIGVWRDPSGAIRITMISDDNYRVFQRTEFVDYRLP